MKENTICLCFMGTFGQENKKQKSEKQLTRMESGGDDLLPWERKGKKRKKTHL